MNPPVDLVKVFDTALIAQFLSEREHYVTQIGIDGFQSICLLGELAADANRTQRSHSMVNEIYGRRTTRIGIHL